MIHPSLLIAATGAMTSALTNSTRDRALELLGDGLEPSVVASALGISPSMVSQYLSEPEFKQAVTQKRYEVLAGHNTRDRAYDEVEDVLLKKLKSSLNMVFDPMKIAALLRTINSAERRGTNAPAHLTEQRAAVTLNMPTFVMQKFVTQTNIHNQVVSVTDEAGNSQSLVTIQSKRLADIIEAELPDTSGVQKHGAQNAITIASPASSVG